MPPIGSCPWFNWPGPRRRAATTRSAGVKGVAGVLSSRFARVRFRAAHRRQAHVAVKSAAILAAHGVGRAEGADVREPRFGVQKTAQKAVPEVIAALAACIENTEARAEMAANPVLKSRGRASTS